MKPDFSRQTAEPMTATERDKWCQVAIAQFQENGANTVRLTLNEKTVPGVAMTLVEGWRAALSEGALPPPHFHLTKGEGYAVVD